MYQALYRKWRPRSFEDVVGQAHITDTLRRQVESGRLSHAYLFTGTRGTGKTTCAKLLARAVNCEHPVNGSPCNCCPSCRGIENGSVLDVLELDAASNNRVDDVRALLDEATYTPAAVRKRVYIVDEVHMLTTQAFNALLQILEEPPAHLMFILATTEIHKVPATIKSRCQQFSFKRIHADDIAARLLHVAKEESLPLTAEGAALIARLADGGMRDALSLLDQCIGNNTVIGEDEILSALGLAGNVDTVRLMSAIAAGNTEDALTQLDRLYAGGKEMAALLGELSSLTRDLLIRKTAPTAGSALMTGGFDSGALKELSAALSLPRLVHMLSVLQRTGADMARSTNRRIDAELCLVTLCDPAADGGESALAARLDVLEQKVAHGIPVSAPIDHTPVSTPPAPAQQPAPKAPPEADDLPPWAAEPAPKAEKTAPKTEKSVPQTPKNAPKTPVFETAGCTGCTGDWATLRAALQKSLSMADFSFVGNPTMVGGTVEETTVTLWADSDMVRILIDTADIKQAVARTASSLFGRPLNTVIKVGRAPAVTTPAPSPAGEEDPLDAFLSEVGGLGNVTVTD